MYIKNLFKKSFVIGIIVLFIGTGVATGISGKINRNDIDEKTLNTLSNQNICSLNFHIFDKTEKKQNNVNLPTEAANNIYTKLEELKYMIVYKPRNEETQNLKIEFVDLLDTYGLIPAGLTKNYVLSLLNPSWLNNKQKTSNIKTISPFLKSFESGLTEKIFNLLQNFKNCFGTSLFKNIIISPLNTETAEASFCSISSGGNGVTLPLFLLPRPRVIAFWTASSAITMVGELLSPVGKGFVAEGAQSGSMLGFTGLGITYAFPGNIIYGFVGYAVYTKVSADSIDLYPPNNEPVISDENPPSGTENIPVSLSELNFRISDLDGDLMDYTVTTEPNIGSGSGNNQKDGVYTVQISGLGYDKSYSWTVSVTDGKDLVEKEFNFITAIRPFDPFDEGWQYRKMITIDHTKVTGNLNYFPVLISVVDVDLRDKAQDDGDDILFMDGVGVAYKLCHEIESFDGSSGKLVAWVRIPNLDGDSDTVFYIYYGNSGCSSQQAAEKVWDSSYCGVWHLGDFYDSTQYDNDGTIYGANFITGISGSALSFDGDNDYVSLGNNPILDGVSQTVTQWIRYTVTPSLVSMTVNDYTGMAGDWGVTSVWIENDGRVTGEVSNGPGNDHVQVYSPDSLNTGDWIFIVTTYDNTQKILKLYINGLLVDDDSWSSSLQHRSFVGWYIGAVAAYFDDPDWPQYHGPLYFEGDIDEVRISNIARNQQSISTEYNNQNDPSSFFSVGPEETSP